MKAEIFKNLKFKTAVNSQLGLYRVAIGPYGFLVGPSFVTVYCGLTGRI